MEGACCERRHIARTWTLALPDFMYSVVLRCRRIWSSARRSDLLLALARYFEKALDRSRQMSWARPTPDLLARIDPAKARKPGEIGIRRIEDVSALHREDGEMSVGCEVPSGPEAHELLAKPREV
jgi:hypothetical protein